MAFFCAVVVVIDFQTEPDFLQDGVCLVAARFACLHRGLVLEFAVVHQFAHRWAGVWGDLNKVEVCFLGKIESDLKADNTDLFPSWADESNLGDTDSIVDARLVDVMLLALMTWPST